MAGIIAGSIEADSIGALYCVAGQLLAGAKRDWSSEVTQIRHCKNQGGHSILEKACRAVFFSGAMTTTKVLQAI